MKKKIKFVLILSFFLIAVLAVFGASLIKDVKANSIEKLGKFADGTVPAWVVGHEEKVKTKFTQAYSTAGFTANIENEIVPVDLGAKAQVMLFQKVGTEGALVLNDVDGKMIVIKDSNLSTTLNTLLTDEDTTNNYVILGLVKDNENVEHIITTVGTYHYDTETSKLVVSPTIVGKGDHDYSDVTQNDFNKAYQFGYNYYENGLGLPTGAVVKHYYNTRDLQSSGLYVANNTSSIKAYTFQEFDNGYIIQARVRQFTPSTGAQGGNATVAHGAAPILKDMYNAVLTIEGNTGTGTVNENQVDTLLDKTGAPVSIEYTINGVRYQNFEYGYVKYDGTNVTFVEDLVVDSQGTEMNRRIGAGESFNNWNNTQNNKVYQISWERLRVGMHFRDAMGELIRAGRCPYATTEADPLGNNGIHHVPHESNGIGVIHIYKNGTGQSIGYGNAFLLQGYWYNKVYEIAPPLNQSINKKSTIGCPSDYWKTLFDVTYQSYEKGFAYTDGITSVWLNEAEFSEFMGAYETVEEALVAKGIAEENHTVKFLDYSGKVIKEVTVKHGETVAENQLPDKAMVPVPGNGEFVSFGDDVLTTPIVSKNVEFAAVYNAENYAVNYVLPSGAVNDLNPTKHYVGVSTNLKPASLEGNYFLGWFTEETYENRVYKIASDLKEDVTLYAKFGTSLTVDQVGEFAYQEVPDWVVGHEETVKKAFENAYQLAELTALPNSYVQEVDLTNARVMLYQIIGNEAVIVLNEVKGTAMTIKNVALVQTLFSLPDEQKSILLNVVTSTDTYLVTDKGIFKLVEGNPVAQELFIGKNTVEDEIAPGINLSDVIINDFGKAYKLGLTAGLNLGLPVGTVETRKYTTIDIVNNTGRLNITKNEDGTYTTVTSEKDYYIQEFENGYIIMGQQKSQAQYGAAPISKEMYQKVIAIEGNNLLQLTGAPVSLPITVNNVLYQNFEYGYVKVSGDEVSFHIYESVDNLGNVITLIVGQPRSFSEWNKTSNNGRYFAYERLRITQEFRNLFGKLLSEGRLPYVVLEADPYGLLKFHQNVCSAPSYGLWMIMKGGDGIALGYGNCFIYQTNWYTMTYELNPDFNRPSGVDNKNGAGRPIDYWKTLYNISYQLCENGLIYNEDTYMPVKNNSTLDAANHAIVGDAFIEFMSGYETVEEALIGHGFAEAVHTVTFVNEKGEVLGTVKVNHGESISKEDLPVAPVIEGYVFESYSEGYDKPILRKGLSFTANYGIDTIDDVSGKYKTVNYSVVSGTLSFWYEDEEYKVTVNSPLFEAWRQKRETVEEAIVLNGLPIYADDTNFITTLKWYYIADGNVLNKATIGELSEEVTTVVANTTSVTIGEYQRKLIQDSFGDAYIFARERGGFELGLPTGNASIRKYVPNSNDKGTVYDVIIQEFTNGLIVQKGYDNAAFPIYGDMLTAWRSDAAGEMLSDSGIGVVESRQFKLADGSIAQNFTYGNIILKEGEDPVITFTEGKQLDYNGQLVDYRFGRLESRNNAKKGHVEFEHEFLRVYEAYMALYSELTKSGYKMLATIETLHEWNANGITQGFAPTDSTASVWGQTNFTPMVMKDPYGKPYIVRNEILYKWAGLGGNVGENNIGFPLENDFVLEAEATHNEEELKFNVSYQNFERGYIRSYIINDTAVCEHYAGYNVSATGEHTNLATGLVEETPAYDLSALDIVVPVVDKTNLIAKLAELVALREGILELNDDIANLPKENKYAEKSLLDEADALIAEIQAIISNEEATENDILEALVSIQGMMSNLNNRAINGQKEESQVTQTPPDNPTTTTTTPTPGGNTTEPQKRGCKSVILPSIVGFIVVLGVIGFTTVRRKKH